MSLYLYGRLPHGKRSLSHNCLLIASLASLLFLSGCAGGSSSSDPSPSPSPSPTPTPQPAISPSPLPSPSPSPSPVAVAIAPESATIAPAAKQQFTATVSNTTNQSVTWSVVEGADGGTVDGNGLYTASSTMGTYRIMVKSSASPSKTATATVTVPLVVSVSPATATTVSSQVTFKAAVNHAKNKVVTWKVQEEGGGTINPDGVYTPPVLGGDFHIIATSTVDGTTQGVATVNVESGGASGVVQ